MKKRPPTVPPPFLARRKGPRQPPAEIATTTACRPGNRPLLGFSEALRKPARPCSHSALCCRLRVPSRDRSWPGRAPTMATPRSAGEAFPVATRQDSRSFLQCPPPVKGNPGVGGRTDGDARCGSARADSRESCAAVARS